LDSVRFKTVENLTLGGPFAGSWCTAVRWHVFGFYRGVGAKASDQDWDDENWTSARPAAVLALEHLARLNDVKHSEEMFRHLANSMPQIIWTGAADGRMDYWNDQAMAYSDRTFEELANWKWHTLVHRDDRRRTVRVWREALEAGRTFEINYRIRRGSDGTYRWHLGRGYPVRDHCGRVTRWIGTCTDIHDQIEAQQQLDGAQELAQIGSWHMDISTRQFRPSAQLLRMAGDEAEVSIRRFLKAMEPAGRELFLRAARASLVDRSPFEFWHRIDCSGAARLFHHRVQMIAAEGRLARVFGTMQDVTEYFTSAAATDVQRTLFEVEGEAILLRRSNDLIRLRARR
jgi:PAS domain S-box-containing protein